MAEYTEGLCQKHVRSCFACESDVVPDYMDFTQSSKQESNRRSPATLVRRLPLSYDIKGRIFLVSGLLSQQPRYYIKPTLTNLSICDSCLGPSVSTILTRVSHLGNSLSIISQLSASLRAQSAQHTVPLVSQLELTDLSRLFTRSPLLRSPSSSCELLDRALPFSPSPPPEAPLTISLVMCSFENLRVHASTNNLSLALCPSSWVCVYIFPDALARKKR